MGNVKESTKSDSPSQILKESNSEQNVSAANLESNVKLDRTESLLEKYKKVPKRVNFTQSNFFTKNVGLIGGKSSGSGYKEINSYLPEGWKMKTFNEFKKFFLTPDFVVLKSPTAVVEYLRLSLQLSHDDMKSLAGNLKIADKLFDRYLDDLYDGCVLLD